MSYHAYDSYKDSGVQWLGDVPSGWRVLKLKYGAPQNDVRESYSEQMLPYVGLEHLESWTGKRVSDAEAQAEGIVSIFEKGHVLFGKLRPYLAKVHLATDDGCSSTEIIILNAKNETFPNFLKYYMLTKSFIEEVNGTTFGSKMPRANWENICLLYTSPSPRDLSTSRMPSSA